LGLHQPNASFPDVSYPTHDILSSGIWSCVESGAVPLGLHQPNALFPDVSYPTHDILSSGIWSCVGSGAVPHPGHDARPGNRRDFATRDRRIAAAFLLHF
jgi:ribosomal protein L37AE/L43A